MKIKHVLLTTIGALLVVALVTGGCVAPTEKEVTRISMGSGSLGGSMYVMGAGLTTIWYREVPELSVSVESTGGAPANIKLIGRKKIQCSLMDNGPLALAYEGIGAFEEDQEVARGLRTVYTWPKAGFQFITRADSGIMEISDLLGKKVMVGARGSSAAAIAPIILEACGITKDNTKFVYLSSKDGHDQLKDGLVDCIIQTTLPPYGLTQELALLREIRLLSIEEDALRAIIEYIPGGYSVVISPDVYGKNQMNTEDIVSFGYGGSFVVLEEMDEELVYRCAKSLWENIEEFHKVSAMCSTVTQESVFDALVCPLHKGAEKYYKEMGWL